MSDSTPSERLDRVAANPWIEKLARIGYATKGVVYGLVGVLALQAAFGAGGDSSAGSRDAIRAIARQPFGQVLLALTALGLVGYALWRFLQASADPEDKGRDAEGLAKRLGYAVSGLLYAGLGVWTAQLVLHGRSSDSGGEQGQEWTARLLNQPFGPWLVGLVGAIIIGVGLYHFYKAYKASFMKQYKTGEMSAQERKWARRVGRFGLAARGVTFVLIGVFLIRAALQSDPSETKGVGGALQTLAEQPYGPWLLAVVAAGFVAYGLYCFSRARYRHFETS